MNLINIGDEVKDQVTGTKGIALSRTEFLYGCVRVGVQIQKLKDKIPGDLIYFDEPQLIIVTRGKLKPAKEAIIKIEKKESTGGPVRESKNMFHKIDER
jgi:hypothetical protein